MSYGVRAFIACVFAALGISFLFTSGVLIWEFWDSQWITLATFYSHLFLFFPTFGIVTLFGFYTPACVFTDMYMRHVPYGIQRYAFGLVISILLSIVVADSADGLTMVYRENLRRFFDPVNHRGPIYLYGYVIFLLFAPWSALLPAALVSAHGTSAKKSRGRAFVTPHALLRLLDRAEVAQERRDLSV